MKYFFGICLLASCILAFYFLLQFFISKEKNILRTGWSQYAVFPVQYGALGLVC